VLRTYSWTPVWPFSRRAAGSPTPSASDSCSASATSTERWRASRASHADLAPLAARLCRRRARADLRATAVLMSASTWRRRTSRASEVRSRTAHHRFARAGCRAPARAPSATGSRTSRGRSAVARPRLCDRQSDWRTGRPPSGHRRLAAVGRSGGCAPTSAARLQTFRRDSVAGVGCRRTRSHGDDGMDINGSRTALHAHGSRASKRRCHAASGALEQRKVASDQRVGVEQFAAVALMRSFGKSRCVTGPVRGGRATRLFAQRHKAFAQLLSVCVAVVRPHCSSGVAGDLHSLSR